MKRSQGKYAKDA